VELTLVASLAEAQELARWLGQARPVLGVDTETGGLDWWREDLRLVQVGDARRGWAVPWPHWGGLLLELLGRYEGPVAFHNWKFDAHFLEPRGLRLPRARVHDTKLLAHLLYPTRRAALKVLAGDLLDPSAAAPQAALEEGMRRYGWTWATVPVDFPPYWQYAALDPVLTAQLAELLLPRVRAGGLEGTYDLELTVQQLLADMERAGLPLDVPYCQIERHALLEEAARLRDGLRRDWGLEQPGSPEQLVAALERQGRRLEVLTEGGHPSIDEPALRRLEHPLAEAVLRLRHVEKVATTYLGNFVSLADGDRLHPSVNQTGARTGRMSVSRPSLQNIPRSRQARAPFRAPEGARLVFADFDQIELRLLAHYAQEERMLAAIRAGVDLHAFTAQRAYGVETPSRQQRQVAKSSNFAIIYGAGPAKFAETAGLALPEAQAFLAAYDRAFPAVRAFIQRLQTVGQRREAGEGEAYVMTWGGRRLPADVGRVYTLVNYLIQGTAAEVLKARMVALDQAGLAPYLRLPVHDELLLEVPEADVPAVSATLRETMADLTDFAVPLTVTVTDLRAWGDKYEEGG